MANRIKIAQLIPSLSIMQTAPSRGQKLSRRAYIRNTMAQELVYKKDPNSIRRYALWHLKNKDFGRFTKLLLIYLSVLIERKKRKLSKKLAH